MNHLKCFTSISRLKILVLLFLFSIQNINAQEFQFTPSVTNQIFHSSDMATYGYSSNIGSVYNDRWLDQIAAPTTWTQKIQFKSISNIIKVGIDHNNRSIIPNYKYRISLAVKCYNDPANTNTSQQKNLQVILKYNKDSLQAYNDLTSIKMDGACYKMDVTITNISDITNDTTNTMQMPVSQVAGNFFIETSIESQAYDLDQSFHAFFTNSAFNTTTKGLNVNFGFFNSTSSFPSCGSTVVPAFDKYNPVKYELEWTYIDDYHAHDYNNTTGSYVYNFSGSSWNVHYNFKNNATRIQTYNHSYEIPIVYEHGAIVYRVRTVRPDPTNYSQLIYGAWDLPDNGSLTSSSFSSGSLIMPNRCQDECLYFINSTTFNADKFDWQYSINFAEEGKYKHVLNYFDGAGHERQTQTKINTDNQYVVAADHIYDYEGRPGIQTLPIPVLSQTLDYKPNLSYRAGSTTPYSAIDFDKGCVDDSIVGFDNAALASVYYSPANTDKTGMQAYVPDAQGYPFIHTIYSPDNTNKVIWQGGAGYNFQHFKKHGTTNTYVRADQYELDKLFGTQAGRSEYYPKVISKDPNKQLSYSIYNQSGKVVATALLGGTDTTAPIVPLENKSDTATVSQDLLANLTQDVSGSSRSMNYAFFPDAAGNNSLFYHGSIPPYSTGCSNWFVNAQGRYKIKVVDECGTPHYADSGVAGVSSITTSNTVQHFTDATVTPFNLTPDKFTIVKQLYFPDTTITRLAANLVDNNSQTVGQCYDYQDDFILRSVNAATFPCTKTTDTDVCDIMKKKMIAELYPGAKYGKYNKTSTGSFGSGLPNSIFSWVDSTGFTPTTSDSFMYIRYGHFEPPEGGVLLCNDAPPNFNNPDSLIYIGVTDTIYTNSATPPASYPYCDWYYDFIGPIGLPSGAVKFRYQFNCTTLPTISWPSNTHTFNGGIVYNFGPANGAPPDALIANFNDAMATALLPLHPEYCKLLMCDDHIEDILRSITTYEQAQVLGLETLNKITLADPICNTSANPTAPIIVHDMSYYDLPASSSLYKRIDSLSLEQAYCGCEATEAYMYCKTNEYANQIKNFVMADTTIQNTYIRRLIANYIANRELRVQIRMGLNNSCGPCQSERMTLVDTPVFPIAINENGGISDSLHLPSALQTLLNQALAGTPISSTPSYVTGQVNTSVTNNIQQQALNIMASLHNCTFPTLVPATPTDSTLIVGDLTNPIYCGSDGKSLTPDIIKTILTNRGVSLNMLCNPYLIDYGVYNKKSPQISTPFIDKGADFYTGMQTFINRTEIKNALTTANVHTAQSLSITTNASTNRFEADLASVLGYVSGHTLTATGYTKTVVDGSTTRNYIAVLLSDATSGIKDTLFFTQRLVNAPPLTCSTALSASPIVGQSPGSLTFSNLQSIFHDPMVSGITDGITADNLVFANLTSTASGTSCGSFAIWGHTISMLKRKDPEATDGCINCVQITTAAKNYFLNATTYSMAAYANDPTFQTDFKNYLNYSLGKNHTYDEYERLMKGCALSDQVAFPKSLGQYKLTLNTEAAANVYLSALNTTVGSINIDYLSYKNAAGNVTLWFDLNSVSSDKYLTFKNVITGASPVVEDMIPNALVSVLVPSGSCVPTWTSYAPAGTSVNTTSVFLKDGTGAYTLPYTLYSLVNTGAVTEKSIADLISSINNFFNPAVNPCASGIILPSRQLMRSSDYSNAIKQSYLTYVYGLGTAGYSQSDISDRLAPNTVRSSIASLASDDLMSYKDPWCDNTKENLYYGISPTTANAGWSRLSTIVSAVTGTSGLNGKMFPSPSGSPTITVPGTGNSLKVILMSNGWSWYRYFDSQNKLYNVYLQPAAGMIGSSNAYTMVPGSLKAVIGPDSVYRFKVNMQQTFSSYPTHTVTCYGYADFTIGSGSAIQNVVLYDNNGAPACLDTLPCERSVLLTAVQQGKRLYGEYTDSLKQYHYLAMRNYFPSNTIDTLDFKTIKQQYQYTLYYYDLAGNLSKTVPPAGVAPMADISQVDVARNSTNPLINQDTTLVHVPSHSKVSEYKYNAYNQLVSQTTPDAGKTTFFYDDAQRLVFSQNAHQRPDNKYSYTLYDAQGRVYETGAVAFALSEYSAGASDPLVVQQSRYDDMSYIIATLKLKAKEDVVATFYDSPLLNLGSYAGMSTQENLRKRVSSILYKQQLPVNDSIQSFYTYATHFSYDALGNVKTLVQDNPYMDYMGQRFKRVDYDYDLLSGKVNMVSYNRGRSDQFYQKYTYDADNRIITAETSNDGLNWDRDAAYEYYKHGPLAKVSIGDQTVQTMQYAYTIQGWLKAINGDVLDTIVDMGKDGMAGSVYPADVIAHALDYHNGDYNAIGGTTPVKTDSIRPLTKSLYNGNIARQTTAIYGMDNLQRSYQYDQLNRIKKTDYLKIDNLTHAIIAMANASAFANSYSYDPDGNIKTLIRHNDAGAPMDSLAYHYQSTSNNKLDYVADGVTTTAGSDLPSGQGASNYVYDEVGNLVHDNAGHVDSVYWNLYGKVSDISLSGSGSFRIHYDYDGTGNRVRKDVFNVNSNNDTVRTSDVYVRDATGNILAVYKGKSKLTGSYTIDWINDDIVHQHGGWVTTTNHGLIPFLIAQWGHNGQFVTPLIHTGIALSPSWGDEQSASLSLSQYLTLSDGIYTQATHENFANYFEPLVSNYKDIMTTTFIGDGTSAPFLPVLNALTSDKTFCQPTLLHMTTDAKNLTSAIMNTMRLTYTGDVNKDAITLASQITSSNNLQFMSAYSNLVKNYDVTTFYTRLETDASILNQTWFSRNNSISKTLSDNIYAYAPRDEASNFFSDYLVNNVSSNWLSQHSTIDDRLNIVYNVDAPTFLNNYLNGVGINGVNTALHTIPQLTVTGYLHAVWRAVLVGTLNPTYTPPDVNTPDPGSQLVADTLYLSEHHLYGSSRLGIKNYDTTENLRSVYVGMNSGGAGTSGYISDSTLNKQIPWFDGGFADWIKKDKNSTYTSSTFNLSTDSIWEFRNLGAKKYELTDHLGNVLATILDKKTGYGNISSVVNGITVHNYQGFNANLADVTDYYPGGMMMPGRNTAYGLTAQPTYTFVSGTDFNDGTAQGWQDRGTTPTPINGKLRANVTGPNTGMLWVAFDGAGTTYRLSYDIDFGTSTHSLSSWVIDYCTWTTISLQPIGNGVTHVEQVFTPPCNEIAVVIQSDGGTPSGINENFYIDNFKLEVVNPPSNPNPPTVAYTGGYRMGFNGQEKTDEVYGKGVLNYAKFWEYNSLTLQRWNRDPCPIPAVSPYAVFDANPISKNDILGNKPDIVIEGDNNSSLTLKTPLIDSKVKLSDYWLHHDFKGNSTIDLTLYKPDAFGIDLSLSGQSPVGGAMVGLNILWHTRGEKSKDAFYPELHSYAGGQFGFTPELSANGGVGVFLAWATNPDGSPADNRYVANGFNWTGTFWGVSRSKGEGLSSGSIGAFTARSPSQGTTTPYWSGFQVSWTPGFYSKGGKGTGNLTTLLNEASRMTLKGALNQSYYFMLYGNGSDYLPKSGKDVSGWHLWNPIDPKDDK